MDGTPTYMQESFGKVLTPLCLSVLLCKIEMIVAPYSVDPWEEGVGVQKALHVARQSMNPESAASVQETEKGILSVLVNLYTSPNNSF